MSVLSREDQWQRLALSREKSATAGALRFPQPPGDGGCGAAPSCTQFTFLAPLSLSLAPCHYLIMNSVGFQVIQLSEPLGLLYCGELDKSTDYTQLVQARLGKYLILLFSCYPALNFLLSWWPGNYVLSFPAIICTTWVKIPWFHLIQHSRAKNYLFKGVYRYHYYTIFLWDKIRNG